LPRTTFIGWLHTSANPPYIPTLNRYAVLGFASMYPRRLERGAYGEKANQLYSSFAFSNLPGDRVISLV
jgi:hypothetical protein